MSREIEHSIYIYMNPLNVLWMNIVCLQIANTRMPEKMEKRKVTLSATIVSNVDVLKKEKKKGEREMRRQRRTAKRCQQTTTNLILFDFVLKWSYVRGGQTEQRAKKSAHMMPGQRAHTICRTLLMSLYLRKMRQTIDVTFEQHTKRFSHSIAWRHFL